MYTDVYLYCFPGNLMEFTSTRKQMSYEKTISFNV